MKEEFYEKWQGGDTNILNANCSNLNIYQRLQRLHIKIEFVKSIIL